MVLRRTVIITVLLYIGFGAYSYSFAQSFQADSATYSTTAKDLIKHFETSISYQSEIYNGVEYTLQPPGNRGTFYFLDKNYTTPSLIRYNDTWYKNVPVLYDVHLGQMVALANNFLFVLQPENVNDIFLWAHHFINYRPGNPDKLEPGYYDALYEGRSQVLVKRTNIIEEHIVPPQVAENWYVNKTQVYIRKGSAYVPVDGQGGILGVFGNRKKEVSRYLSDNKIKYKTDPEIFAAKAAAYYDKLNN